jgi:hypothetical protein
MAVNPAAPAFIDPPGPYASLQEWIDYREELRRMNVPATAVGLKPFLDEADDVIARLRSPEK